VSSSAALRARALDSLRVETIEHQAPLSQIHDLQGKSSESERTTWRTSSPAQNPLEIRRNSPHRRRVTRPSSPIRLSAPQTPCAGVSKMVHPIQPGLRVGFFRSANGKEPVREWLLELTREERKVVGEDLKTVQFGWSLGMPVVRPLGEGLEVCSNSA
jgi:hypothetical protein